MYRLYEDIRERCGEPLWHDDQGVPRYRPYHPRDGGIYDRWSALLEIECQGCRRRFLVGDCYSTMDLIRDTRDGDPIPAAPVLPTAEHAGWFCFGDAPWHEAEHGQCSGTTMSTGVLRVVEFWAREHFEWVRHPEYEFTYPAGDRDEI